MKKLLLKTVFMLLVTQHLFGQYHRMFFHAQGFIPSHGAAITHIASYSMFGGGVVLKGIARPKYPDSLAAFTNISFDETRGVSTMHIQMPGSNISYADSTWIMRDAAMLVRSERSDKMYRDVNLLGKPLSEEYFHVEMTDSLVRTKSGELLLVMDLMLAGDPNTKYYSITDAASDAYIRSNEYLDSVIEAYNDSLRNLEYKPGNDLYLKLRSLDSLRQSGKSNSNETELLNEFTNYSLYNLFYEKLSYHFTCKVDTLAERMVDSLFKINHDKPLDLKTRWTDYTYNDENAGYTFYFTEDKQLRILGAPNYTFLYHDYYGDENMIDSVFTNYYLAHPDLIKNLNIKLVETVERFSGIAAFDRYLKEKFPALWSQMYLHYLHTRKQIGMTPRVIGRDPE